MSSTSKQENNKEKTIKDLKEYTQQIDINNINTEILKYFCFFLSSKMDSKYNSSYYYDSIPKFIESLERFKSKQETYDLIYKSFKEIYDSFNTMTELASINFDETFNYSLYNDKITIIDTNNLDKVQSNEILVRLQFEGLLHDKINNDIILKLKKADMNSKAGIERLNIEFTKHLKNNSYGI